MLKMEYSYIEKAAPPECLFFVVTQMKRSRHSNRTINISVLAFTNSIMFKTINLAIAVHDMYRQLRCMCMISLLSSYKAKLCAKY